MGNKQMHQNIFSTNIIHGMCHSYYTNKKCIYLKKNVLPSATRVLGKHALLSIVTVLLELGYN